MYSLLHVCSMKLHKVNNFHKHFTALANRTPNSKKKYPSISLLLIFVSLKWKQNKTNKTTHLGFSIGVKNRQQSFFVKHKLNCTWGHGNPYQIGQDYTHKCGCFKRVSNQTLKQHMTSGSILMTAVGHGINKPLNDYGWEQNNKIRKFCEQQNLRKTWTYLMLQPFSLQMHYFACFCFIIRLFSWILLYLSSLFHQICLKLSNKSKNYCGRLTDSMIVSTYKTSVSLKSTWK